MKVTLLKDHTHAGQPHKAGESIDVDAHDAAWLADHQVIAPLPATKRGAAAEENA